MSNDLKMAWAAGFVDGEGCIRIDRSFSKNGFANYYLKLEVTQKSEKPIKELQRLLGGTTSSYWHGTNQTSYFRWRVESYHCAEVLKTLLPFLVLKKKEAQVGIAFQDGKRSRSAHREAQQYEKMKGLKVRV